MNSIYNSAQAQMIRIERCFTLDEALSSAKSLLETLGLAPEMKVAGLNACAAKCILRATNGSPASVGLGKGFGKGDLESCKVGAVFEAIEHYWTDYKKLDPEIISYISGQTLCCSYSAGLPKLIRAIIDQDREKALPCLSYTSLCGSKRTLYPIALLLPSYIDGLLLGEIDNPKDRFNNYNALGRYSTNSGVAIGMNRAESIVHGMLETIERDATSQFLIDVFLLRDQTALRRLNISSIPEQLREFTLSIEEELKAKVHIYEFRNRFGIPTFCTWLNAKSHSIYIHGFGCSLSRDHALTRSLSEAAQVYLSCTQLHTDEKVQKISEDKLSKTRHYPLHRRCVEFDLGGLEEKIGFIPIDYSETSACDVDPQVDHYLEKLSSIIQYHGATAFSTTLFESENSGISVTHNMISDQDYFHIAREGNIALPCYFRRSGDGLPPEIKTVFDSNILPSDE